ncbi:MAG: AAA family ATPase [Deltaproteobacteria bacterium]|nr:AAA family ATPase [Deltaproteobacteria bacterium]
MQRLAFFGKGGIGKTTIASNIAILFTLGGNRVLQIGCDPKHDSAYKHVSEESVTTVMDAFIRQRNNLSLSDLRNLVVKGRTGVYCLEIGGPVPGRGCAGRAVSMVLNYISEDSEFFDSFDVAIFDVLGDVVCGGFASPIQGPEVTDVYIVVSSEFMSIYAANNIARGIKNLSKTSGARLAGLIANMRGNFSETGIVRTFAERIGTGITGFIPGDNNVVMAEIHGKTAVEMFPDSDISGAYRLVYKEILRRKEDARIIPEPLGDGELKTLYLEYLKKLENDPGTKQQV